MSDYFDYIMKESALPESYDIDDVITESDLALMEFDQYVQEGIGLKILAGIGIVAALGGLIAIILKLISSKDSGSVSNNAKDAKKAIDKLAKKNPEEKIECELFYGNKWEKYFSEVSARSEACADYCKEYCRKLNNIIGDWNEGSTPGVDIGTSKDKGLSMKISFDTRTAVPKELKDKWDGDISLEWMKDIKDEVYRKNKVYGDISAEKLKDAFDKIKVDKQETPLSIIRDRLDAVLKYNDEFRICAKSLNNSKKEIERLSSGNNTIAKYINETYRPKHLLDEISANTALLSILSTYTIDELRRIKKHAYDKLTNIDKSYLDSALDGSQDNKVNVKHLMNGTVDFDDFMSNPNSQMVFK
jgi:hypothetical protein